MTEVENITPFHNDTRAKAPQVRDMFDSIAPAYDVMNRLMTLGIDALWRRKAVRIMRRREPRTILDVATGTGDLALLMARKMDPLSVTAIDLSPGMLEIGRRKAARADLGDIISFTLGDSLQMPLHDHSFDCVSAAFGVRNFEDILAGYCEMYRVLRPGGMLCVLELSTPPGRFVRPLYDFYTRRIIPFIGRLISRDRDAYTYLPRSIAAVPARADMTAIMEQAGFVRATYKPLTFGVCTLYTAFKPA